MSDDPRRAGPLTPQAVFGLLIIIYGLLLTFDNLGWINAKQVLAYWPVALVVLGVAIVGRTPEPSGRVAGGFIAGVGVILTFGRFFGWHFNIAIMWPLFLVAMGIMMLLRGHSAFVTQPTSESQMSGFAFWSGTKRRITSQLFRRADFTAVMGGIQLDFRGAAIAGEAIVDVFVVMGGLEIMIPPDWTVSNQIVAIMGGVDDKSAGLADSRNHLVLRGFVMMGGVEVKT